MLSGIYLQKMSDSELATVDVDAMPVTPDEPGVVTVKVSRNTRKSSEIFGLGSGITVLDAKITGSRLPSSMQVLRCLMWHIQTGVRESRTRFQSAKMVLSQLIIFYEKAHSND